MATNPPTTSEWPPRYFVVECTTTSAPSASGCWRYGVANVLSTTTRAPRARARLATAAMSTIVSSGLVGVSIQTSRRVVGQRAVERVGVGAGRRPTTSSPAGGTPCRSAGTCRRRRRCRADVVARREQAQHAVLGGQPAGERQAVAGAFERGEARLERRRGSGCRCASTRSPWGSPTPSCANVVAERDRRDDGAGGRIGLLAGVDRPGLEPATMTARSSRSPHRRRPRRNVNTSVRVSTPSGRPPAEHQQRRRRVEHLDGELTVWPMPIVGSAGPSPSRPARSSTDGVAEGRLHQRELVDRARHLGSPRAAARSCATGSWETPWPRISFDRVVAPCRRGGRSTQRTAIVAARAREHVGDALVRSPRRNPKPAIHSSSKTRDR